MTEPLQFSDAAQLFQLGIYEHYKGSRYRALMIARREADLVECVVYQSLTDPAQIWTRPLDDFVREIEVSGHSRPRFLFIKS
jgi:hypothetical protein